MNKKKPLIGLLGASVLAGGAYAFVRNIYGGSKFLDSYVDKVSKIDVNSTFELEAIQSIAVNRYSYWWRISVKTRRYAGFKNCSKSNCKYEA